MYLRLQFIEVQHRKTRHKLTPTFARWYEKLESNLVPAPATDHSQNKLNTDVS